MTWGLPCAFQSVPCCLALDGAHHQTTHAISGLYHRRRGPHFTSPYIISSDTDSRGGQSEFRARGQRIPGPGKEPGGRTVPGPESACFVWGILPFHIANRVQRNRGARETSYRPSRSGAQWIRKAIGIGEPLLAGLHRVPLPAALAFLLVRPAATRISGKATPADIVSPAARLGGKTRHNRAPLAIRIRRRPDSVIVPRSQPSQVPAAPVGQSRARFDAACDATVARARVIDAQLAAAACRVQAAWGSHPDRKARP